MAMERKTIKKNLIKKELGLKNNKKTNGLKKQKKRIIKTPKKIGGFLPLLFPILGALGGLAGAASGIAEAVNDPKANKAQLKEMQRRDRTMEGKGLYLRPYRGHGLYLAPYKKNTQ